MRTICLSLLSVLLFCSTNKDPLSLRDGESPFFPLSIGTVWYFDVGSHADKDNPWVKRIVQKKIEINGNEYFIVSDIYGFDRPSPSTYTDTLRADSQGNIWEFENGQEFPLYVFSSEAGSTYNYKDYIVTLRRVESLETPAGTFNDCIELYFDVPVFVDEETRRTFAPCVGLIRETHGEGPTWVLDSFEF